MVDVAQRFIWRQTLAAAFRFKPSTPTPHSTPPAGEEAVQASLDYYNARRYTPQSSEALATLAEIYYCISVAKDYDGAIWRLLRQGDILDISLQMFRRAVYELDRYVPHFVSVVCKDRRVLVSEVITGCVRGG